MAKFSFTNELWKTKDAQWLAERNEKWLVAEKILANGNNSELASLKKYFIKGEWSPGSRYEPHYDYKFLLLPIPSAHYYELLLEEIPSIEGFDYARESLVSWLHNDIYIKLIQLNQNEFNQLCYKLVDSLNEYSNEYREICGFNTRRFPLVMLKGGLAFFELFIGSATRWLKNKQSPAMTGHHFFLKYWFSGLETMTDTQVSDVMKDPDVFKFFSIVNHYIPNHPSNPAAQAKLEFVNLFKQYAAQGFSHELIESTWQAAKENKEDEWVGKIYECTLEEDPYAWQSWSRAAYTPLICHSRHDINNVHLTIADLYQANGFSQSSDIAISDKKIDITKLLTKEFIAELPKANRKKVQGELVRITLSDEFMGTNKVHFALDIIKIIDLPEQTEAEIPRLLMIERPDNHYIPCLARRYCANREYIVDEIREKTGFQLVRYFGFSHNPTGDRTVPPRPQDYKDYQKEMQLPFYDAAYLPLNLGTTAYILNEESDY
jgi:hypothetical protein